MLRRARSVWIAFWMRWAGLSRGGRLATWLAASLTKPYKNRCGLARMNQRGYVSPRASITHRDVRLGQNVFIGDRCVIYQDGCSGPVQLDDRVHLYQDILIEAGPGGSVFIGADTHIQPRCQLTSYAAEIRIGCGVNIAPACAFYPYDHGIAAGELVIGQRLTTKGPIIIEDNVWLGYGVIVLSGVRIGRDAVIGAGSVVTRDVPDFAIAVGAPARTIGFRTTDEGFRTA